MERNTTETVSTAQSSVIGMIRRTLKKVIRMLRQCKYCGVVYKAYAKASRVCEECKRVNLQKRKENNRRMKYNTQYTRVSSFIQ